MSRDLFLDVGNGLTAGISRVVRRLQGDVVRRGTITGAFSGLPVPAFNPIHVWQGAPSLADDLASVIEHADAAGLETQIVAPVGAEHEAAVLEVAERYGYSPRLNTSPVMVLLDAPIPPLPEGMTCISPVTAAEISAVHEIMADSFGMPVEFAATVCGKGPLSDSDIEWFLLSIEGRPVATSMLVMNDDVAAVFNVAVRSSLRRQGLGAAATWEVVRRGRERGSSVTALEASQLGEPLYDRMGFDVVATLRAHVRSEAQ